MSYQQWYHQYVAGNPDALAMETAAKNRSADREQFREYKAVLGEDMPGSVDEFQRMKYQTGGMGEAEAGEKQ